jgi:serine/threonine-protein kinase
MEFLNSIIGKYRLTRVIGKGGMASVYEGVHEKMGNKVAVKVLDPILSRNPQIRSRFEKEANFLLKAV